MKKLFLFFLVTIVFSVHSQNLEQKYKVSENSPEWIKEMYSKSPNLKKVKEEYEKYYKSHEFIKNQHTQYYKRWLRENEPLVDNEGNIVLPTTEKLIKQRNDYNKQLLAKKILKSNGVANWEEIGPWEYDHAAAMALTIQSPGSAHIYTVEQAPSNSNTIYAGTASAGVWKSTDKGLSWSLITKDLLVDTVQALAIDPTNENIVYFGYDNKIWKTTDGGLTWNIGGDIGYAKDIKIKATNNHEILAATTWGLYRSVDAGVTWSKLINGYMYEIEFHPTDPNIVYAIKSENNRTEFLKSIDGGASFSPRYTGWPGVGGVTNANFKAIDLNSSSYVTVPYGIDLGSATIPNFTVEMKLKSNGWSGDPSIFSNKDWIDGSSKGFVIYGVADGNIGFNIGDGINRVDLDDGGVIDDNQWHHVSITYDAIGDKKIYVDGFETDSSTDNITTDVLSGLSTAFYQDGTLNYGRSFTGKIGEVRVFNTVLDSVTISDNYCRILDNTHPNYANLIHHYTLEEGTGTELTDEVAGNNGIITGVDTWDNTNLMTCVTSSFALGEEQKRTEISVSENDPNLVLALAVGDVDGGSGLVGIYKSTDAGETFNFICCGNGAGGLASATNKNIVGYSGDLESDGGQYYYDLAMDISPTDADKVFGGGIMVVKSVDGGVNWARNNHWVTWEDTPADRQKYVHPDVHDIKFFKNGSNTDLWVATDGGLYYSSDQGETMKPRMHGIQGTEFWGFGSSSIGDAMIGGTYHNGTLWHYENLYLKGKNGHGGWMARGAGDAEDGYIHEANPKWFFDYRGLAEFPDRLSEEKRISFDETKVASYDTYSYSNYEWLPNQYDKYYSAVNAKLWKTNNNGTFWELIHDFSEGKIYDTRTSQANPNVIYVVHKTDARNYVKKSFDNGQNWIDITPPDALVHAWNNNNRLKNIDVSHTNENHIWCIIKGEHSNPKVLQSVDGGTSWTNITGSLLTNQNIISISHQQGTDGGIYVGTTNAIYYKNNTMSDFVLYNQGLPATTRVQFQYPNYTYQKLRIGTYRGAFQGDFFEPSQPIAKPSVDKIKSYCVRDDFHFKDLSFTSSVGHSRLWSFPGGTPSSSTDENPVVSYATPGNYTVSLTVTDNNGTDTNILTDFISVVNECQVEEIPGNALNLTQGTNAAAITNKSFDFGETTDFSISCWIKTSSTVVDGVILSDKDWGSGFNKGWVLAISSGRILFNIGDGSGRIDLSTGSETFNDNKWHYLTATADRDGLASLYIDGTLKESINMSSIGNIFIDEPVFMGVDNEYDYPFDGLIDEVKIWNTAISQNYLREQRHLTAVPANDSNLIAYYQFNRADNKVIDRAGTYHADHINTASNVTSTAPLGGGKSERLIINSGGVHVFSNADLELTLPNSSTYPNGEVVASKMHVNPNLYPNDGTPLNYYWVLNNYGANTDFTVSSILFKNLDSISSDQAANPSRFNLFKRNENEDNDWGTLIDQGDSAVSSTQGNVTFSTGLNLTNTGQFIITDNTSTLTVDEDELNLNKDLLVYPTIASNSNTITIENNSNKKLDFTIYNLLGQKIMQLDNIGEKQLIKVNHFKPGVYLLKFISEDNIETSKKLIIN